MACNLEVQTYLYDLLVTHTSEEYMLFIHVGVETDHIWYFAVAEPFETLSGLRVP